MYLLDTNVVSEVRRIRQGKGDSGVRDWMKQVHAADTFTSVIVIMEIERGILALARKDDRQAKLLQAWFEGVVLPMFAGRIQPIDEATARICSRLHVPNRIPAEDAWIAATALQHDLTVVTRNINDFKGLGVKVFNPFTQDGQTTIQNAER